MTPSSGMGAAYGRAAEAWDRDAALVYQPLADELLDLVGLDEWTGRRILDLGAGAGAVSRRLVDRGVRAVAVDLSEDMLRHERDNRPPALAADVSALPLPAATVDGVVASFVLNHIAAFLAEIGPDRRARLVAEAVEAVEAADQPVEPYRPTVVFGAARR